MTQEADVERVAKIIRDEIGRQFDAKPIPDVPAAADSWAATGGELDCSLVARAAIAAIQGWQDISTASSSGDCNDWSASVENRWAPEDDFFGDPPKSPTHWMPLPAPPEASE